MPYVTHTIVLNCSILWDLRRLHQGVVPIRWDATTTMIALKDAKLRLLLPLLCKITDKSMPFFVITWKMATSEMATKGYVQANVCLLAS